MMCEGVWDCDVLSALVQIEACKSIDEGYV